MAVFLVACANCGLYMKGQRDAMKHLLEFHICTSKTNGSEKSADELKAIVDIMFKSVQKGIESKKKKIMHCTSIY